MTKKIDNKINPNCESVKVERQLDEDMFAEMWFIVSDSGEANPVKMHRKDGPALVVRDNSGNTINFQFWLCGTYYPDFKKWLTLSPIDDNIKAELALVYG